MKNLVNEYVYLDGQYLRKDQLVKLALNAPTYVHAEHYLFALLAYGVINGKRDVINMVNEVRQHFGVKPIPLAEDYDDEDVPNRTVRETEPDIEVRRRFQRMTHEEQCEVLRMSLNCLVTDYQLFKKVRNWYAIFVVVRDRLVGDSLNQRDFLSLTDEITPEALPAKLKISRGSFKNFCREIDEDDRGEVYYRMKRNPQKQLCDTFWEIIKMMILMEK